MHLTQLRNSPPVLRFRRFRRSRPFWGGLLVVIAGLELGALPIGPTDALIKAGKSAGAGLACAGLLLLMGVVILIVPSQRIVAGLIAVGASLASFVLSNLGGFVIGMLLGVLGGSLAVGWVPDLTAFPRSRGTWFRRAHGGWADG
ncbi:MAG TPA: DUF6114 domain-containing protein [Sporichthyaceae bacterium]|jgi:hypothetical protein